MSLVPVVEKLDRIGDGVDRHASELAIRRLREDRRRMIDRIRTQEDRVRDWKRALANDDAQVRSKRTQSIVLVAAAILLGLLSLGLIIWGDKLICLVFLSILGCVIAGSLVVTARIGIGKYVERREESRAKLKKARLNLDDLNAELDSMEAELNHHEKVVRRS